MQALVPSDAISGVLNSVLSDPLVKVTSTLGMNLNNCSHSAKSILVPLIGVHGLCRPWLSGCSEIVQCTVIGTVIDVPHWWGRTLSSSLSSCNFPILLHSNLGIFLAFLEVTAESIEFSLTFQLLACIAISEYFTWGLILSQFLNLWEWTSLFLIYGFSHENLLWDRWPSSCAD